jgi:undecaprenyl-diphosphatase
MDIRTFIDNDYRLSKAMTVAERPGILRTIAVIFAHSGDSWFWGAALLVLWLFFNSFWKEWAIEVVGSIGVLAVLVLLLKRMVRRPRPTGAWGMIYRRTDPHSFPSGHAARAFMIAVLATGLGPGWLAPMLWIWAPLVALARVAMGVHYLSDVLGGLILGLLAGLLMLQLLPSIMQLLAVIFPWLW